MKRFMKCINIVAFSYFATNAWYYDVVQHEGKAFWAFGVSIICGSAALYLLLDMLKKSE